MGLSVFVKPEYRLPFDPGEETASELARRLGADDLLRPDGGPEPDHSFYVSDRPAWAGRIASRFLGSDVAPILCASKEEVS